ncbi:MAG TPA: FtsX-like permease family protein [Gammaproteobacteria bacterium]|nr:FtsX-like permease family protein [Gammaproteobacteria bacterium]
MQKRNSSMEFGPILSAMLRNKTGPALIAIQIALTLAVVVNAVFIIGERIEKISRPSGMDVDNIIAVSSSGLGEDFNLRESVREDLEALEAIPGVVAATTTQHVPLSGSGWGTGLKPAPGPEAPTVSGVQYLVSSRAVDTLGVEIAAGRDFTPDDVMYPETFGVPPESIMITRAMADELFPDSQALGAIVYDNLDNPITIIGIVERMHGAWVGWEKLANVMLVPRVPLGDSASIWYLVRTEPGERNRVMPLVEQTLAKVNDRRMVEELEAMADIRARSYASDSAMAVLLAVVIGLMVVVTAVGIVGLASFAVRQRTKQIGTRRAIGARRIDIIRYFMVENWVVTTFGVTAGTVLAFALNYWLVTSYSLEPLNPLYVPAGIVCLWALGLAAVYGPARRAAAISPAVATRTV